MHRHLPQVRQPPQPPFETRTGGRAAEPSGGSLRTPLYTPARQPRPTDPTLRSSQLRHPAAACVTALTAELRPSASYRRGHQHACRPMSRLSSLSAAMRSRDVGLSRVCSWRVISRLLLPRGPAGRAQSNTVSVRSHCIVRARMERRLCALVQCSGSCRAWVQTWTSLLELMTGRLSIMNVLQKERAGGCLPLRWHCISLGCFRSLQSNAGAA